MINKFIGIKIKPNKAKKYVVRDMGASIIK